MVLLALSISIIPRYPKTRTVGPKFSCGNFEVSICYTWKARRLTLVHNFHCPLALPHRLSRFLALPLFSISPTFADGVGC